jgi:hypothetical protein
MTAQIIQFRPRANPKREQLDEMFYWWQQYFAAFGMTEPVGPKDKEPA